MVPASPRRFHGVPNILRRAAALGALSLVAALALQCRPTDKYSAFGELAAKDTSGGCPEFRVGYDMFVTDFGVAPRVRPAYVAFAQTTGDYVVVAARVLDDVTSACRDLALDFGGTADDPSVRGRSGSELTYAWCNLAARRVEDAVNDTLQPAGRFATHFVPGDCWIDAQIVGRCEAGCSADPSCPEKSPSDRCDRASAIGMCAAACKGVCEGSVIAPAACDGTCDGACEGSCLGACSGTCDGAMVTGERCRGACIGMCEGVCKGVCTGGCHYRGGAASRCDGLCKGGCDAPYVSSRCAADLGPPTCPVEPACEASCKALGQAHASCTPPSVTLTFSDDVPKQTASNLPLQVRLRDLTRNLARLTDAASGRGPALEAEAKAAFEGGASIVVEKNKGADGLLGARGSACARVIQAGGEQALTDFRVAIENARTVLKALPASK